MCAQAYRDALKLAKGEKALAHAMLLGWLGLLRGMRDQLDAALATLDALSVENANLEGGILEYQAALQSIAKEVGRKSASVAKGMSGEPLCEAVSGDVTAALKDLGNSNNLSRVLEIYHLGLEDVHTDLLAAADGSLPTADAGKARALLENALDGDTQRLRRHIFDTLDTLEEPASYKQLDPANRDRAACASQYAQQVQRGVLDLIKDNFGMASELRPLKVRPLLPAQAPRVSGLGDENVCTDVFTFFSPSLVVSPLQVYKDALVQMHDDIIDSLDDVPLDDSGSLATSGAYGSGALGLPKAADVAASVNDDLQYTLRARDDLAQTLEEKAALKAALEALQAQNAMLEANLKDSEQGAGRLDEKVGVLSAACHYF